jgi:hypothetical protein
MTCTTGGFCRYLDACVSDAECGGHRFCMEDGGCYEGRLDTTGWDLFAALCEAAAAAAGDGSGGSGNYDDYGEGSWEPEDEEYGWDDESTGSWDDDWDSDWDTDSE